MRFTRVTSFYPVVLILFIAAASAGWPGPKDAPHVAHAESMVSFIQELCPNVEASPQDTVNLESDIPMIHEFHDCQRLVREGEYQSLAGILAHRNVDTYERPADFREGRLAAVIINFRTKDAWRPYEPLRLAPGTNCLVIRWNERSGSRRSGGWEAGVMPSGTSNNPYGNCPDSLSWVRANKHPGFVLLDVVLQQEATAPDGRRISPPVARWDWNAARTSNTMGVRCGARGWCEIGAPGFTPLAPLTQKGTAIFKGYYDQQYLADSTGSLSAVWGTLRTGKDAARVGMIRRNGAWHEAAIIQIVAPLQSSAFRYYQTNLALRTTNPAPNTQRAFGSLAIRSKSKTDPHIGKNWYSTVNGVGVAQGVMDQRSHPNEPSRFATVRWRWQSDDERVWTYCPEDGCCEMRRF